MGITFSIVSAVLVGSVDMQLFLAHAFAKLDLARLYVLIMDKQDPFKQQALHCNHLATNPTVL